MAMACTRTVPQVRDGDKRLSGCIKSIFDLCDGLLVPGRPPIDQDIVCRLLHSVATHVDGVVFDGCSFHF